MSHNYNKDQRSYVNSWNHLHKLIDIKISKIPYHAKANSSIYYSLRLKKPDKNDYHNQLVSATAVIKFKKFITAI